MYLDVRFIGLDAGFAIFGKDRTHQNFDQSWQSAKQCFPVRFHQQTRNEREFRDFGRMGVQIPVREYQF